VTISGNSTSGSWTGNNVYVNAGDLVTVKCTPNSDPNSAVIGWGFEQGD
jgi:hypothetical protein